MTHHIYRIYDPNNGLAGAQILNEITIDGKALNAGDHYIINNKAYKVEAATGLNFSGLFAWLYVVVLDQELTDFFIRIGVLTITADNIVVRPSSIPRSK